MSSIIPDKKLCDSLSDAEFDKEVRVYPWVALKYEHACNRLNAEQINFCLRRNSQLPLVYPHACARLNTIQFDECIKKNPYFLIRLASTRSRMSLYQKAWTCTRNRKHGSVK